MCVCVCLCVWEDLCVSACGSVCGGIACCGAVGWVVIRACCHGSVFGGSDVVEEVSACQWRGACIDGGGDH